MKENASRTRKYQEQAAKIRIIAEDVRGDESRRVLLKAAQEYERMGLDLEVAAKPARRARSG